MIFLAASLSDFLRCFFFILFTYLYLYDLAEDEKSIGYREKLVKMIE